MQPEEADCALEIRNTQITFKTPKQPNLHQIQESFILKLAVRRNGDQYISGSKFDFNYEKHVPGNCLECDWNIDVLG